jgi:hypothetical protein
MSMLFGENSASGLRRALNVMKIIVMWMAILPVLGQTAKPAYQTATIVDVKTHQESAASDSSVSRYDITIRLQNNMYVVLYTPPPGTYGSQYMKGMDMQVLVGDKTITYNDMLGVSREVPILSRMKAPEASSNH